MIRISLSFLGTFLLAGLIYFSLPRVWNPDMDFGVALEKVSRLSSEVVGNLDQLYGDASDHGRAVMILKDGDVLYESGDVGKIMNVHSNRKAILSLLYGIAIEKGLIDLNKTLAELNIDESTPLTAQEKSATIQDLLMSRSGIYLPAKGEHDAQITDRPARESHKPGEYFFHNNFDYNVLGTIFVQETGMTIGQFMEKNLAIPLGMQDFDRNNIVMGDPWFFPTGDSLHEMYHMYISTRDHVRIGAMVANRGVWEGKQVVPRDWIDESTSALNDLSLSAIPYDRYDAAGYVWWIDQDTNTIWSDGVGGHFLLIDPKRNLAMVERNFTGNSFLTTGLWIAGLLPVRDSPHDLIKAHELVSMEMDRSAVE